MIWARNGLVHVFLLEVSRACRRCPCLASSSSAACSSRRRSTVSCRSGFCWRTCAQVDIVHSRTRTLPILECCKAPRPRRDAQSHWPTAGSGGHRSCRPHRGFCVRDRCAAPARPDPDDLRPAARPAAPAGCDSGTTKDSMGKPVVSAQCQWSKSCPGRWSRDSASMRQS